MLIFLHVLIYWFVLDTSDFFFLSLQFIAFTVYFFTLKIYCCISAIDRWINIFYTFIVHFSDMTTYNGFSLMLVFRRGNLRYMEPTGPLPVFSGMMNKSKSLLMLDGFITIV